MREIKFRAWETLGKKRMVSWEEILSLDTPGAYFKAQGFHFKFMQYIGRKDKNNKEIYEKDIVKYRDIISDEYILGNEENIGVVNWIDSRCSFNPQEIKENHKSGHYVALWDNLIEIEVIGNIYESPELLKKKIET